MAWSDAARKAAAAARRSRSMTKNALAGGQRIGGSIKQNDITYRQKLAQTLRAVRQGRVGFNTALQAGHLAARSTFMRNLTRKKA